MKNLKLPFYEAKKFNPLILDVETQNLAEEVPGGWDAIDKFRVSVAVSWDPENKIRVWREEEAAKLVETARDYSPIVTFNGERFDFIVLSHYAPVDHMLADSKDLLVILRDILGHRLYMDTLSKATLGISKTGEGTDAVKWWRSGDPVLQQKVIDYCIQDVMILKDLYYFARNNRFLLYSDLDGGIQRVNLNV